MNIKTIPPEQTYPVRHNILRPNQTIEDCHFPGDHEPDTFHLGAFIGEELISIASFYKEKHPDLDGLVHNRLRGMATLENFRKEKAGSSLLARGEEILKQRKCDLWWCNARTGVAGYYKKIGLQENGEVFELPGIGPHIVMYKKLL
ncbi:hypothetical protein GA0061096_0759 [Fictibacillus enclensis]|uniref:Acetyltransferase n=1 Tax=Fictibacillus enclensis TaxID=1017270 RepID=A0A0V8JCQ3_9BACL|nr:GNAT family N-acetyltransferase [Fictibacillus enclensis]KSU84632.1 acetyltransferase [Fictibacillus enclensis]SCB82753.1 hypothetical protein GA0061096_0759 [Fictibacillus enclensis]